MPKKEKHIKYRNLTPSEIREHKKALKVLRSHLKKIQAENERRIGHSLLELQRCVEKLKGLLEIRVFADGKNYSILY